MKHNTNSRDKILNSASNLFRTQGYNATSLNQITKESGAPRGSIYYYFPNGKEELALEAIKQTSEKRKKMIQHFFSQEDDVAMAISNQIASMSDEQIFQDKVQFISPKEISLVALSSEVWASNETLRQACEDVYEEWQQLYCNKLIESGYDKETAQKLGIAIQSWIEGAYVLSVTAKDFSPMSVISEQIFKLLNRSK